MEQHSKYIEATSRVPITREKIKFRRCFYPAYNKYVSIHDQNKDNFPKSSCINPEPRGANGNVNLLSNRPQSSLPNNTETNPKEKINVIMLQSGKQLEDPPKEVKEAEKDNMEQIKDAT